MHSLNLDYLENQSIPLYMMSESLRTLGKYQGLQAVLLRQKPKLIQTLKEVAIIQSAESSNRMEGVIVPRKRLEALLGNERNKPQNRPEAQVLGYRNVLARIHNDNKNIEITLRTILDFHKEMFKYTDLPQGQWKRQDNTIEEQLPDGQWVTRFEPVSAIKTPEYMEHLCKAFTRAWHTRNVDPLIVSLAFVFDFLCIHPFSDGNGRISRLLTVLLLHKINIDVPRYLSLERSIENTKQSYYEILKKSSVNWHNSQHQLLPWFEYHISLLIDSYRELEHRINLMESWKGDKTAYVLDIIEQLPLEFSVADLLSKCPDVSRPMIRHILEMQRSQNKLQSLGKGRSARWKKILE